MPMKPATNTVAGLVVDLLGRADLLDPALVHDRDPVAHRERLFLVVGHVDERDADLALDALELELHRLAQLEVERAERLVEQQRARVVHERAGERDALLLAAGELAGLAVGEVGEPHDLEQLARRASRSRPSPTFFGLAARRRRCPRTDMCGNSAYCWKTVLTLRLYGRHPRDVLALEADLRPSDGCSKPAIIRSVVVLPQPGRPEHREELAPLDRRSRRRRPPRSRRSAS